MFLQKLAPVLLRSRQRILFPRERAEKSLIEHRKKRKRAFPVGTPSSPSGDEYSMKNFLRIAEEVWLRVEAPAILLDSRVSAAGPGSRLCDSEGQSISGRSAVPGLRHCGPGAGTGFTAVLSMDLWGHSSGESVTSSRCLAATSAQAAAAAVSFISIRVFPEPAGRAAPRARVDAITALASEDGRCFCSSLHLKCWGERDLEFLAPAGLITKMLSTRKHEVLEEREENHPRLRRKYLVCQLDAFCRWALSVENS